MTKAACSTHPLSVNPILRKAVEMFYESLMAPWCLEWHTTFLSTNFCAAPLARALVLLPGVTTVYKYLYSKCCCSSVAVHRDI